MQNFSANKNFGQHFLKDQSVIKKIVQTCPDEAEVIFEIGPGTGALTFPMAKAYPNKPYYLFEKDERFLQLYQDGFHLHHGDAVKFDFQAFIQEKKLTNIFLVSNLPYNVGSVIFTNLLPIQEIKWMGLMFQKEVGEKTLPVKDKEKLSSLSVLTNNYFEAKKVCLVPPGSFQPPPKVNSIVNFYQRKSKPLFPNLTHAQLNHYLRMIFLHPRKTLRAKLQKSKLPFNDESSSLFALAGKRAEDLNLTEIEQIIFEIHSRI